MAKSEAGHAGEQEASSTGKTSGSSRGTGVQAMAQGSLFAAAEAPAGGLHAIPVITAVSGLPLFASAGAGAEEGVAGEGTVLALLPGLPGAEGLLIAGMHGGADKKTWECVYTGPVDALAKALLQYTQSRKEGACTVVAPDCKLLCKTHPGFWALPEHCWFDLSLAAYLLSPEDRGYGWEQVSTRWGEQSGSDYAASEHPGLLAIDIFTLLRSRLAGAELTEVFTSMEMPLVPVLARMEERGITVDKQAFAGFLDEVLKDLDRLTGEIHRLAGRSFNIRSSQQLSDVLFSVLDLPKAGKTRGGAASTSQEALEKLAGKHPIIEAILDYRKLEKLRSTYLEPLPLLADAEGRIHTTFNQTATATGRLSSSNPNLQNIPIRGAFGGRMRSCFIAAPEKTLVCADYSQIELRVLAHLSGDPTLLDAFHKNEDIHARTAGLLYDVPLDEVTHDQRRNAKTINFGLIYGMGAQRLAQELHIGMKEAKEFIERYFSRLTRLKEFYEAIEEDAKKYGFVATMAGRRRFTPEILSQNNQLRSQARRQAINARIQGSAADIIKLAMIAVENDSALRSLEARLLLQIHDELVLEAPAANAEAAGKRLAELMGGVRPGGQEISVPLLVDWGTGHTWAEAH
jgi:DNA polymerase-1